MSARQGTPEWFLERAGHATASEFSAVMAKPRSGGGEAATRRKYRVKLITERLTGIPIEGYRNAAMDWGNEQEPAARSAYEARIGSIVEEVGFTRHPLVPWCGASSDGLVGDKGMVQIKCPYESSVHLETLLSEEFPSEHLAQIQGELWVYGREWCDFVSYDPRMPANLQLYVYRIQRSEIYIAKMVAEIARFLAEVEELTAKLLERPA